MRCEVLAVGTELLLGHVVDTNSAWIGERLAAAGIDCHVQTRVGDNVGRVAEALRLALGRAEAVIVCGGLGPTADDVTREAIAAVMGADLVRDGEVAARIRDLFARRGRTMPASNLRQADVPAGAEVIPQVVGTAPGLICPVGERVVYAVPGVPHEMREMVERAVLGDLRARAARAGEAAVIVSRVLRTWGESESGVAELLAPRVRALDAAGNPTIAFLASGIEGIKVRVTAKAADEAAAHALLAAEEAECRALLGPLVFGVDSESMQEVVGRLLAGEGLILAVAESLTGGLVGARVTDVAGSNGWFIGGVVAYDGRVKHDLLGVPAGPVVSAPAAEAMATGVARLLGAGVGLATTGVAGPAEQEGHPPGTVFVGLWLDGRAASVALRLPGDRARVREYATVSALNLLRLRLLERAGAGRG